MDDPNAATITNTDPQQQQQAAEPTLADLMKLIKEQGEALQQLSQQINSGGELDLTDLAQMTDEQLIEAGFDPAKVDAALQEAVQNGELTVDGEAPGGGEQNGAVEGAAAGTVGAELAELRHRITYFERKEKRENLMAEKQEQEQLLHAFDVVEKKCIALAAENEALRHAAKLNGANGAASPGTEIQLDAQGKEVTFEKIVSAEFARLVKGGMKELAAKSKAIDFGVKRHGAAYAAYRSKGSPIIEFSVPA